VQPPVQGIAYRRLPGCYLLTDIYSVSQNLKYLTIFSSRYYKSQDSGATTRNHNSAIESTASIRLNGITINDIICVLPSSPRNSNSMLSF